MIRTPKGPAGRRPSSTPRLDETQVQSRSSGQWGGNSPDRSPVNTIGDLRESQERHARRMRESQELAKKAKELLESARNLKTDIKLGVMQAIEKLRKLVDEEVPDEMAQCKQCRLQEERRAQESFASEGATEREERANEDERRWKGEMEKHYKVLVENNRLLKENAAKIEGLKETVEVRSYAAVTASAPKLPPPEQAALHSVAVTAKSGLETADEVLTRIRTVMRAKEGGVCIERVRKAKDGKIIIGCRNEEDRTKVKERLERATELRVEPIKNKDPLVLLKNVLKYSTGTDDEIKKAIRNQNEQIFSGLQADEQRIEVAFKKRNRNPLTEHVVLRVSAALWRRMTAAGALHIDLQRVRVEDQSPLVQCSQCLGYGHGRRFCTEAQAKCSHCGGPHMRDKCEFWMSGATPTCCNCLKAKLDRAEHSAFSPECPIRRKWDSLARAAVAYC